MTFDEVRVTVLAILSYKCSALCSEASHYLHSFLPKHNFQCCSDNGFCSCEQLETQGRYAGHFSLE